MATLWFIRHGQASFGATDYDSLSPIGERQAIITGDHLHATGKEFAKAYTGTLSRQIRTAEIALKKTSLVTAPVQSPLFDEYDHMALISAHLPGLAADDPSVPAEFEKIGEDRRIFQHIFSKIIGRWVSGRYTDIEEQSFVQFFEAVRAGVTKAAECTDKRPILIFTSGGVISVVLQMALGISATDAMTTGWRIKNGSISIFTAKKNPSDGQMKIAMDAFNVTAHLDIQNDPALETYR